MKSAGFPALFSICIQVVFLLPFAPIRSMFIHLQGANGNSASACARLTALAGAVRSKNVTFTPAALAPRGTSLAACGKHHFARFAQNITLRCVQHITAPHRGACLCPPDNICWRGKKKSNVTFAPRIGVGVPARHIALAGTASISSERRRRSYIEPPTAAYRGGACAALTV